MIWVSSFHYEAWFFVNNGSNPFGSKTVLFKAMYPNLGLKPQILGSQVQMLSFIAEIGISMNLSSSGSPLN